MKVLDFTPPATPALSPLDRANFEPLLAAIALSHHEQYNGKGYPHGFRGSEIPLEARIVAVADLVDALLSNRPHRRAWSLEQVLDYLKQCRGQRLDPECVDAFFEGVEPNQLVQLQQVSP